MAIRQQQVPDLPRPPIPKITTEEIGELLDEEYEDIGGEPIDYFYLQIRKRFVAKRREVDARVKILRAIAERPEGWQKVTPGRDWPSLFFAKFKKERWDETEREREQRLNSEVRSTLKQKLEDELADLANPDAQPPRPPVVHIMITRACKYTNPPDGFLEDEDYMEVEND